MLHHAYMMEQTQAVLCRALLAATVFAGCTSAPEASPAAAPRATQFSQRRERSLVVPRSIPAPKAVSRTTPATLEVVKGGLESTDWMVRLTATSALGCLPGSQALAWLERQLADVEADVRAAAIESLRFRNEPRAFALLVSVQDDTQEDFSLRVLAAAAVSRPIIPCH